MVYENLGIAIAIGIIALFICFILIAMGLASNENAMGSGETDEFGNYKYW